MHICATLSYYWHKLILKVRLSSGQRPGASRPECSRPTFALTNRTCKSNLHGTSSYDSQWLVVVTGSRRISVPLVRVAYFRHATFRVSPLGPVVGLRKVLHRQCTFTCIHTHARIYGWMLFTPEFRDCTFRIVPLPLEEQHDYAPANRRANVCTLQIIWWMRSDNNSSTRNFRLSLDLVRNYGIHDGKIRLRYYDTRYSLIKNLLNQSTFFDDDSLCLESTFNI